MDDAIMEKIVKDLEEADETGGKFAGALLEVLALVMRWKSDPELVLLDVLDAGEQVMTAIEKGMT